MMRNLVDSDLSLADRCAARRQYKTLRLAMYANIEYTGWDRPAYQGCYGMDRDAAKKFIRDYYAQVSWADYLGSK